MKRLGIVTSQRLRMCFVERKRRLLRKVADDRCTPAIAVRVLDRLYERQTREYLRSSPAATYREWLEHGPRPELVELREAARFDHVWDRLVDRVALGGAQ